MRLSTATLILRMVVVGGWLGLSACAPTNHAVRPDPTTSAAQREQEIMDACRALVIDYAVMRDAHDVEGYVALFSPDAQLTLQGQTYVGHDAIRQRMQRAVDGPQTRHLMSTIRITPIDDTRATGVSYATIYAGPSAAHSHADALVAVQGFAVMGDYIDEFVRTENGWRIASRSLKGVFRSEGVN